MLIIEEVPADAGVCVIAAFFGGRLLLFDCHFQFDVIYFFVEEINFIDLRDWDKIRRVLITSRRLYVCTKRIGFYCNEGSIKRRG